MTSTPETAQFGLLNYKAVRVRVAKFLRIMPTLQLSRTAVVLLTVRTSQLQQKMTSDVIH